MKVAFRVDGNARIGGGHVMRCLTLADELKARGAETLFIAATISSGLADRVRAAGHDLHVIAVAIGLEPIEENWDSKSLAAEQQARDARLTCEGIGQKADWVIVDHYLLDAEWHREARQAAQRLMVIDDLANRRLDCDLLLDQTLCRSAGDYAALAPEDATMLLGPTYALLRPEFAQERPAAIVRRRESGPVRRILLSLGTTDVGGVAGTVLEAILPVTEGAAIDVVLSHEAPSLGRVRALAKSNPLIAIHLDASNMAELMRDADLAIGAAGTTSWERCCLGLPALALTLAANQASVAQALARADVIRSIELTAIATTVAETLENETARARMSAAAFAIVDGLGAARVAEELSERGANRFRGTPSIRAARLDDAELLWLWRNDPLMRKMAKRPEAILWPDHCGWFYDRVADSRNGFYIAEYKGAPSAMVRFDHDCDAIFTVSLNVAPHARGKGIGAAALAAACDAFDPKLDNFTLQAEVLDANLASERTFLNCGFKLDPSSAADRYRRFIRTGPRS